MIISVKEVRNFFICLLIPILVGYSSSLVSSFISGISSAEYYSQLLKPGFAPPSFVFPIVWTTLFILMGISSYLILKKGYDTAKVKDAMFYYWLQLGLNFIWSILFFGLDLKLTALVNIIILIIVVVIMIFKFKKVDKIAAILNIPYLLWLFYAMVLNGFIWILNK